MTVKDLKDKIADCPDDYRVIIPGNVNTPPRDVVAVKVQEPTKKEGQDKGFVILKGLP